MGTFQTELPKVESTSQEVIAQARQRILEEWDPLITRLLIEVGKKFWSNQVWTAGCLDEQVINHYLDWNELCWLVNTSPVRMTVQSFWVILSLVPDNQEGLLPGRFCVWGKETLTCSPQLNHLKDALTSACGSGPYEYCVL